MIPPVVKRLISVRELRAVAIKYLVELSVEHDFLPLFFLREKLVKSQVLVNDANVLFFWLLFFVNRLSSFIHVCISLSSDMQ